MRSADATVSPPAKKVALIAALMLLLTTVTWGLTFPLAKAVSMGQQILLPSASTWFLTAHSLTIRFGLTALILWVWLLAKGQRVTRLEVHQGVGLGLFAAFGLLLQMDGLNYTKASTSAFLTQFYCLIIPLFVAWREKIFPSIATWISCLLVLAGVAVLAQFDWSTFRMGRGEWETLVSSVIFAGLILWLERPMYAANNSVRATLIMAGVITAVCLPVVAVTSADFSQSLRILQSGPILILLLVLTLGCTLTSYLMMNFWQPYVSSTQAGLIYCAEPVFASLFALFLPQAVSTFAVIEYPNEKITRDLLFGGGLISLANLIIIHQTAKKGKAR